MTDLIARAGKRLAPLSVAAAVAAALTVAPALAQKVPPLPPFPDDPFGEALDYCGEAADSLAEVEAALVANGWSIDDYYETGPFIRSLSASKEVVGASVYFYATAETYATAGLVYCTYDIEGVTGAIDFTTIAADFGLEGNVQTLPEGTYGAWQSLSDNEGFLITARQEGDFFFVQVNWIGELTTGTTGPK